MKTKHNPITELQDNGKIIGYYLRLIITILLALKRNGKIRRFDRSYAWNKNVLFFHVEQGQSQRKLLFKFNPYIHIPNEKRVMKQSSGFSEIAVKASFPFDKEDTIKDIIVSEITRRDWGTKREDRALRLWTELSEAELKGIIARPFSASQHADINGADIFIPIIVPDGNSRHYLGKMPFNAKSSVSQLAEHKQKYPLVPAACIKSLLPGRDGDNEIKRRFIKIVEAYKKGEVLFLE